MMHIILSCEHAVNTIPEEFISLFRPHQALLKSHRGLDIGAQSIARKFADTLQVPYIEATTSRLLIECNRTLTHPLCFSFITKSLDQATKQRMIERYYLPHREAVFSQIDSLIQQKKTVLHLSIHSFTPTFNDEVRVGDLGLLYDPRRPLEKKLAPIWQKSIIQQAPHFHIRRNYPYLGKSNGLTTTCRQKFPETLYAGFEIEFNQGTIACEADKKVLVDAVLAFVKSIQTK